jgi:Family of unknown function (DUF5367)
MYSRILLVGLLLWTVGTVAIRFAGQRLLHPDRPLASLILYLGSFVLMGLLARRIFRRLGVETRSWPTAATLLMLPTLILDPFSCVFFASIFPKVDPRAAGIFGGWMLICCGGVAAAVWIRPGDKSGSESRKRA